MNGRKLSKSIGKICCKSRLRECLKCMRAPQSLATVYQFRKDPTSKILSRKICYPHLYQKLRNRKISYLYNRVAAVVRRTRKRSKLWLAVWVGIAVRLLIRKIIITFQCKYRPYRQLPANLNNRSKKDAIKFKIQKLLKMACKFQQMNKISK